MLENFAEAFSGIFSHKLRSALTMLGIIIGIASIIAISSTIMGTNEQIKQNLIGGGRNTVEVQLYQGEYPFESAYRQVPDYVPILESSILPEITALEGVEEASLYLRREAYDLIWRGNESLSQGQLFGIDGHFMSVHGYVLRGGRAFIQEDFDLFRKVVLIDRTVSETLFPGENPIGQVIEIQSEPFTVVGEFTRSEAFTPRINSLEEYWTYMDNSGGKLLIPYSCWPTLFSYDLPSNVVLRASSTDTMTVAGRKTAELLNSKFSTDNPEVKYASQDLLKQAKNLQELSSSTNMQLILIASISLLVGGIGVMNIMLVSVTERTSEIGLKKALGAGKRRISLQFLTEAGVLTCMGGILGVLVGVGLAYIISRASGVPILISWYIVAAAVVFSFVVGLFFGAVPAIQAARLNPIEALRRE